MPDDADDEEQPGWTSAAFDELEANLTYARDLVRGGRHLERLKVGAFDVADLYRAAWVQAVSALDHWIHREFYERALGFALNVSVERPAKFLSLEVPMSLFEDVHHHSKTMRAAFLSHLRARFGYQSFQAPEKIKQALGYVSNVSLWPSVAKQLSSGADGEPTSCEQVQAQLKSVVQRRNKIAHEADRDPGHRGARQPISDHEAIQVIDWLELIAKAILAVLGPPPPIDGEQPADPGRQRLLHKWTRREVDQAVARFEDPRALEVVRQLLSHADAHDALFRGGISQEPSAGFYYWLYRKRRSFWSLYTTADRPSIALNLGSISPHNRQLADRMIAEIRSHPALDAALFQDDASLVQKSPTIDLHTLAEAPDAVEAIKRALNLAARVTESISLRPTPPGCGNP